MIRNRLSRRGALWGSFALATPALAQTRPLRLMVALDPGLELPFDATQAARPGVVFEHVPLAALQTRLAASVAAGRPMADAVLTSLRGLAAGLVADIWTPWRPDWRGLDVANAEQAALQRSAGEWGQVVAAGIGGPFLVHDSERLPEPPRDAAALLAYARRQPGRFTYVSPALSPASERLVCALPHMLGDADPDDPQAGWSRSWAFMTELAPRISYHPASPAAMNEGFLAGEFDLIPGLASSFPALQAAAGGRLRAVSLAGAPQYPLGLVVALPKAGSFANPTMLRLLRRLRALHTAPPPIEVLRDAPLRALPPVIRLAAMHRLWARGIGPRAGVAGPG